MANGYKARTQLFPLEVIKPSSDQLCLSYMDLQWEADSTPTFCWLWNTGIHPIYPPAFLFFPGHLPQESGSYAGMVVLNWEMAEPSSLSFSALGYWAWVL
jgi:hypothetical protein